MKTVNRIRLCLEELEGRLVPSTLTYSTNWSGYAVNTSAGAVSAVAGSWVVPKVSSSVSGYSSAWVGIDGFSSSSVEQIGTDSDYVNGQAQYYAWYEMYPNPSINLGLTIAPGDTISASVSYTGSGQYALSITDTNTGGSFSTNQTSSSAQRSSAEWIQEAPSSFRGVLPLANFGTINFSGANATINGSTGPADNPWSGSTLYQIDMATGTGTLKATTSALTDSGSPATSSFNVTWDSSGSSTTGGHHHKSDNMPLPLPVPAQSITLPPSATPAAAVNAQGLSPAFIVTQSSATTAILVTAQATMPTAAAGTATIAYFGSDSGSPDTQPAGDARAPAAPVRPAAGSPSDAPVNPQPDAVPSDRPQTNLESGAAAGTADANDAWLPAVAIDDAWGSLNGGHRQGVALAGLVLTLAFDRSWTSATRDRTGKRDRLPDPRRGRALRR